MKALTHILGFLLCFFWKRSKFQQSCEGYEEAVFIYDASRGAHAKTMLRSIKGKLTKINKYIKVKFNPFSLFLAGGVDVLEVNVYLWAVGSNNVY